MKLMDDRRLISHAERWPGGRAEGGGSPALLLKPQRFWQRQRRQKWAWLPHGYAKRAIFKPRASFRGNLRDARRTSPAPTRLFLLHHHLPPPPAPPFPASSSCPASATVPPPHPRPRQTCRFPWRPGKAGVSPDSRYLLWSHGERCGRGLGSAQLAAAPRRSGAGRRGRCSPHSSPRRATPGAGGTARST